MSTNPPTLLANEKENKTLCGDVAEGSYCKKDDKQVFYSKNLVKCSKIRFTVTGSVSGDPLCYAFKLSGIELFGYFNTFPKKGVFQTIINKCCAFFSSLFSPSVMTK